VPVAVGGYPHVIAVTPRGCYAIVATSGGKALVAIDIATRTVAAIVPAGAYPNDVLVAP